MVENKMTFVENILKYIFQMQNLECKKIEIKIIYNYADIINRIERLKEQFVGDTEIIISTMNIEKYVVETYQRYSEISYDLINRISIKSFKKEIESVLSSEKIEKVKEVFKEYCQVKTLLTPFQEKIINDLEKLSLSQNYIVSFHSLEEQSNSKVNKKIYHR